MGQVGQTNVVSVHVHVHVVYSIHGLNLLYNVLWECHGHFYCIVHTKLMYIILVLLTVQYMYTYMYICTIVHVCSCRLRQDAIVSAKTRWSRFTD